MAVIVCMSTFAFAEHESANPKTDKPPQGQTGTPGMFRLPTLTDCGAPANIIKMITEYEEVAVANGQTFLIKPDGFQIPIQATNIHGISHVHAVENGVSFNTMLDELKKLFQQNGKRYPEGHD